MRHARAVAVVTSLAAATLYALIGLGVLHVGTSRDDPGGDLTGFGAAAATAAVVVAVALLASRRRWVPIGVALYDVAVIGMYVAVAAVREPPFEVWGLAIKALQLVQLVTVLYLATHGADERAGRRAPPKRGEAHARRGRAIWRSGDRMA